MGRGPDGRRMCKLCGLTGGDVTRIKNHIESVHWPHSQGYACEQCNAICKTRHALACHKSRHHSKNKNNAAAAAAANNLTSKIGGKNNLPDLPVLHPDLPALNPDLPALNPDLSAPNPDLSAPNPDLSTPHPALPVKPELVETLVTPALPTPVVEPEPVTPASRRGRKRSSKRS